MGRLQRLTAAAQAGIAVPFLVIGGIHVDRARVTATADVGFKPHGRYAARLNLNAIGKTEDDRRLFVRTVQENLGQAPGVVSVSVGDGVPLDFIYRDTRVAREGESAFVAAHTTRIGAGFLQTLGIPLLAGRTIEANDRAGAEPVVVLSGPLARQLFPANDAIGKRVVFALTGNERQAYTVVGVTGDLVSTQMGNPRPQLFVSLAQHPTSTVFAIARGRAADPSLRRAFENAVVDAHRQSSAPAPRQPEGSMRSGGDFGLNDFITGEGLIENSRSDLLTASGVSGAAAGVALIQQAGREQGGRLQIRGFAESPLRIARRFQVQVPRSGGQGQTEYELSGYVGSKPRQG